MTANKLSIFYAATIAQSYLQVQAVWRLCEDRIKDSEEHVRHEM
jgi:hypothetical protein